MWLKMVLNCYGAFHLLPPAHGAPQEHVNSLILREPHTYFLALGALHEHAYSLPLGAPHENVYSLALGHG